MNSLCLSAVASILLFCSVEATSRTVARPSFEELLSQSELIGVIEIVQGEVSKRHSYDEYFRFMEFSARVESVAFGMSNQPETSLEFISRVPLKIGTKYLVLLDNHKFSHSDNGQEVFVSLLALEVVEDDPFSQNDTLRWSPIEHPRIPGLTERTARVDIRDYESEQVERSIALYSYYVLNDVQAVIRELADAEN